MDLGANAYVVKENAVNDVLAAIEKVTRFGTLTTVFWYDPNNDSVLEAADAIASPTTWQVVTNGVVLSETTKSFSVTNGVNAAGLPSRWDTRQDPLMPTTRMQHPSPTSRSLESPGRRSSR